MANEQKDIMTHTQWLREDKRLKGAATRARTKLKNCMGPLAEKIELKRLVALADESIRQHKLHYFDLVTDPVAS